MTAKLPRWSLTLVLALAAWGGITRVSAQTASPARGDAGAPVAAPAAVASANVEWSEGDSTTVDSLALDRDPIESSPLIPVTGFS